MLLGGSLDDRYFDKTQKPLGSFDVCSVDIGSREIPFNIDDEALKFGFRLMTWHKEDEDEQLEDEWHSVKLNYE